MILSNYFFIPGEFFTSQLAVVFTWKNDPKVSIILAYLNNIVVWIVSIRHLLSKSSSPFTNPSVTVPRTPITMAITATFMFHSFFFDYLEKSKYLFFFLLSFNFTLWSFGIAKSTIFSSFWLTEIGWFVCMSHMSLCVSFSMTGAGLCL